MKDLSPEVLGAIIGAIISFSLMSILLIFIHYDNKINTKRINEKTLNYQDTVHKLQETIHKYEKEKRHIQSWEIFETLRKKKYKNIVLGFSYDRRLSGDFKNVNWVVKPILHIYDNDETSSTYAKDKHITNKKFWEAKINLQNLSIKSIENNSLEGNFNDIQKNIMAFDSMLFLSNIGILPYSKKDLLHCIKIMDKYFEDE